MTTYDHWLLDGPGGPHDDALRSECLHCHGPLETMEDMESGECEQCWRDRNDAQRDINAEFDALATEAERQAEPEPELEPADMPF
jgi:hypothetical protein